MSDYNNRQPGRSNDGLSSPQFSQIGSRMKVGSRNKSNNSTLPSARQYVHGSGNDSFDSGPYSPGSMQEPPREFDDFHDDIFSTPIESINARQSGLHDNNAQRGVTRQHSGSNHGRPQGNTHDLNRINSQPSPNRERRFVSSIEGSFSSHNDMRARYPSNSAPQHLQPTKQGVPPDHSTLSPSILSSVASATEGASNFFANFVGRNKKKNDGGIDSVLGSDNWVLGLINSNANSNSTQDTPARTQRSPASTTNFREKVAMVGMVLCLFVGMNLSLLRNVEKETMEHIKRGSSRYIPPTADHHAEGMDRPNSRQYLQRIQEQRKGNQRVIGGIMQPPPSNPESQPEYTQPTTIYSASSVSTQKYDTGASQFSAQTQQGPTTAQTSLNSHAEQLRNQASTTNNQAANIYNQATIMNNQATPTNNQPAQIENQATKTSSQPAQAAIQTGLPSDFNNIATIPSQPSATDIPFFWHIPKAGGSSIKEILGVCLGFTLACELGGDPHYASDTSIETFQVAGKRVVNFNFYSPQGIDKARLLGIASSRKVDVFVSPYLHETARIFSPKNQGRLITMMRNPIERASSNYWLMVKQGLQQNPLAPPMTIVDYAKSNKIENNWMTRFLTNKMSGPLQQEDLQLAKDILAAKFIVGLLEFKEESLQRFDEYFGWNMLPSGPQGETTERQKCVKQKLAKAPDSNTFSRIPVKEGSKEASLLLLQNNFDMELYKYAKELFQSQKSLFM